MLVACRLAGLSALGAHYGASNDAQFGRRVWLRGPACPLGERVRRPVGGNAFAGRIDGALIGLRLLGRQVRLLEDQASAIPNLEPVEWASTL